MGWRSLRTISTDNYVLKRQHTRPVAGVFEGASSRVFYLHEPQALDNAAKSVSRIHDLWLADSKAAMRWSTYCAPAADPVSVGGGRILSTWRSINNQLSNLGYLRGFSRGAAQNAEALITTN